MSANRPSRVNPHSPWQTSLLSSCMTVRAGLRLTVSWNLPIIPHAGQPLCPAKRRKWCDVPKNLADMQLSPDHVYTFHIWQHLIDFSSYKLSVGRFMNVDLAAVLNGQPLQLTVIDTKVRLAPWLA